MTQAISGNCLSPKQRYQKDLQQPGFNYDPSQEKAVAMLQSLYDELTVPVARQRGGVLGRMRQRFRSPEPVLPVKGLYFWGGVGRGKTYLMDNFYESLPFREKMRAHFHRFMRRVHRELKQLAGEKNPLERVADNIAEEARVICFDEFFVSDITDAMLLGTLLEHLFARGVTLVATSNIVPDRLYENGLQRQRFLPAIALLNRHTSVVNVDGGVDYRLRALEQAELYHAPLGPDAERAMLDAFNRLAPATEEVKEAVEIEVEGRRIPCRFIAEDVIWFDFEVICNIPRSQNDYIELAKEFHAVLVGNVHQMGRKNDDHARRFVNMVDEFYDRNVKLVLSAEVDMVSLYTEGKLSFEFERTRSRLLEMQSHDYLARPHRP
ncbi:cell division protein ZapE [Porticoccus litoralis]|jgi:cell division protein ZapE|uniref:Cell division protein ZapE n=1 Tax=Porticoccus litoralis TaxID=434086 RepID=A0AAW8B2D2_9GAMM|nr:cell division protein ZapE [Porticoccus litoralis]MDP1520058.1 cell division protein ZapE [Porticoccus litoralis]TNE89767.1 MAG: cell division protein ZapE [Gammaproteobacteria bacterium]